MHIGRPMSNTQRHDQSSYLWRFMVSRAHEGHNIKS